jgi:5-methylcytosine-specific restriction protein A
VLVGNDWKWIPPTDPRITDLSDLLRQSPEHASELRGEKFRNPNGVARKMMDLLSNRPDYHGVSTHCGKTDLEVIAAFLTDTPRMLRVAARVREEIELGHVVTSIIHEVAADPDMSAAEGAILMARHIRRERDPKLRKAKLEQVKSAGSAVSCEVCGFDFESTYGERGRNYIEIHHIVPLHVSGPVRTRLGDLALVCSNCHRILHRGRTWLTPDQLSCIVQSVRQVQS